MLATIMARHTAKETKWEANLALKICRSQAHQAFQHILEAITSHLFHIILACEVALEGNKISTSNDRELQTTHSLK